MQGNIKPRVDDVQCYQTARELRWPDGVACPSCESTHVIKRGCDDTEPARQRYEGLHKDSCKSGHRIWTAVLSHVIRAVLGGIILPTARLIRTVAFR